MSPKHKQAADHGTLRAAAARRDITPPVGTELSGFVARLGPSTSIADALQVRAVAVESEGRRSVLLQADLLGFAPAQVREVRHYALRLHGMAGADVLLSATHTHSGPGLAPVRGCALAPEGYQRHVIAQMCAAMDEAVTGLTPCTLELGEVAFDFGVNRRQETPEGAILGVAPAKPRPRTLRIARLASGRDEIVLYSHAAHPYCLGADSLAISGDFPGLASDALEQDGRTTALFLNGCAGNIAPPVAFQGWQAARREALRMAATVRHGCDRLTLQTRSAGAGGASRLLHLPYAPLPRIEELPAIACQQERVVRPEERVDARVQTRMRAALREWEDSLRFVLQAGEAPPPVACEIQLLRLGPLVLLGISGEPFFEIGEQAVTALGLDHSLTVWPLGYTNVFCGYIPTRLEFPLGGYEVNDSWKYLGWWQLQEDCGERVIAAAAELATTATGAWTAAPPS